MSPHSFSHLDTVAASPVSFSTLSTSIGNSGILRISSTSNLLVMTVTTSDLVSRNYMICFHVHLFLKSFTSMVQVFGLMIMKLPLGNASSHSKSFTPSPSLDKFPAVMSPHSSTSSEPLILTS